MASKLSENPEECTDIKNIFDVKKLTERIKRKCMGTDNLQHFTELL